ncbi:flagellar hook-length control protein FliK [uncultured Microbulbifer sp.]|uniref:flagellar hook-length control protein FliK n=1 Tax=uncultured Microbulbifer sp. TaxID=348147 RepID=UPI0026394841|nr:flagellar hook-length control protein FliK [uncultured Microbulbifer sp.]
MSSVARQLSNILSQSSATTSVIRSPVPVVSAPVANAIVAAGELRERIELSGLFYEAHLVRWHRGERDRSLLDREPQMALWRQHGTDTGRFEQGLQGLVRQQLDLLSIPKLRWEGELWPGLFAEFLIQQVAGDLFDTEPRRNKHHLQRRDSAWCAEIKLQLQYLGAVVLSATMHGRALSIQVKVRDNATLEAVSVFVESLQQRFLGAGFTSVQADVVLMDDD